MGYSLLEGNEAIAWGALRAGCRFFAGYPLTPATSIYSTLLNLLPPAGGYVLQGEDEIASLGLCLGASMAGLKAMTATSGPGLSLYSENISLAIAGEIPVVIVDVQRLGPSTGAATRGADGDVQFMRWGNSGGLPVIVLAPRDAYDCYRLTFEAFNLAEAFRCPVFLASNKEIGQMRESVNLDLIKPPEPHHRRPPADPEKYLPFEPLPGKDVPGFLPIGSRAALVRQTSSTHAPDGYLTTDPGLISQAMARLNRKLVTNVERYSFFEADREAEAETLVLTYGVTARAAKKALKELRAEGRKVSLLTLQTLWPVPEGVIRAEAARARRVLVVEMNLGQYVREIHRVVKDRPVEFLGQMNGQLITPASIKEAARG